jgi:hypothetical protein
MDVKEYLRYYHLEEYLFSEVNANFQKDRTLTPEEFLAIIIWKSNRSKTNVVDGFQVAEKTVRELMALVAGAADLEKINLLIDIGGIGIPIASAILTVCYKEKFTLVDYRSCAALAKIVGLEPKALRKALGGDPSAKPEAYLAYVDRCKTEADRQGVDLRKFDQILWGMDFFEGEGGLKELAARLREPES